MGFLRNRLIANSQPSDDQDGSDASLVAQAREGDSQAFALLYQRYVERVYDFCYLRLGNREAAEDATQTVFLRAVSSLSQCRDGTLFAGWLFAIARNAVYDGYRSRKVQEQPLDDSFDIEDPSISPDELAMRSESKRELEQLRQRCLTTGEQELLDLRLQGLSDRQIAEALGRSHGAIRVAQHRLVAKLRNCMAVLPEVKEAVHVE